MKPVRLSSLVFTALACATFTFIVAVCGQAQTFSYLADFNGTDGLQPFGSVMQATDGNLYGTTTNGGGHGYGNVYRLTPSGQLTSIYDFCVALNCSDGETPESAPALGTDGNLYGTTTGFGSNVHYGYGSIYKMTLDGSIKLLYTFCSLPQCVDGAVPNGLMLASDGNFYGTTQWGGSHNTGTIFKISPTGEFTSLYSFCSLANCADGYFPTSTLIQREDGSLIGTTVNGGGVRTRGGGVIYQWSATGGFSVIVTFHCASEACPGGSSPNAITQDAAGNLYGATQYGGGSTNYGTIFELTSKQEFITLHTFDKTDGAYPNGGLTLANDGNFYGITAEGGPANAGTIYQVTPAGEFRTLYTFAPPYGDEPVGALFQATNGNLYGATPGGPGLDPNGTIFQLSIGLSSSVQTVPAAGAVGRSVLILGNNLTGSSSVTFNGVQAAFTVESDTYIKATVPKDATTGIVSVVTPSGTLNSNPQFVVTK